MPWNGEVEVFIRPPRLEDRSEFLGIRERDREWLQPWEPIAPDPAKNLFSPGEYERYVADSVTDRRRRFLIWVRDTSGERIVGQAALNEIIRGPLQQAFLGYWISRAFSGQGIMTRGLQMVLAQAFGELGLHRVEANIQPHNAPSIALAKSIGFRKEGYSPKYLQIQGGWADHERWAMVMDEFLLTTRRSV
jgi:ribosomal-protein-alanine N-acetyltransferase